MRWSRRTHVDISEKLGADAMDFLDKEEEEYAHLWISIRMNGQAWISTDMSDEEALEALDQAYTMYDPEHFE